MTAAFEGEADGPAVTVCIVAYRSGDFLRACVDGLAAQTFADFEAVIADNCAEDGTTTALRLPDGRFRVRDMGGNLGFAAANNRVAEASSAPLFATLNPDTLPEPGWLSALVDAAARRPEAASFGSTQLSLADPTRLDGVGDVWHAAGVAWRAKLSRPAIETPPEGEVFGPCAAAALYRRDAFMALGGFHEPYFCYCEDLDLAYRLRLRGWTSVQVPTAVVLHAGSGVSGRTSEFSLFHGHRNRVWTFVRDTPGVWFWLLLPYHLAYDLALLWVGRKVGGSGAILRAYAAALRGLPQVWGERRAIQRGRTASDWAVLRTMAWSPLSPRRRDVVRSSASP